MNTTIAYTQLKNLSDNHKNNPGLPFISNGVTIELSQLDKFIAQAKMIPECDAIKIYFIRYPLTADGVHIIKTPSDNLSQISLALVPAEITTYFPDWESKDLKDEANNIFALLVCNPDAANPRKRKDKNCLCPPKPPVCQ
jgi:hypothetical protein